MLAYRLVAAAPGRYSRALGRRATCIGALAIVGMAAALCVSSADAATVSPSGAVGVPPVLEVGAPDPKAGLPRVGREVAGLRTRSSRTYVDENGCCGLRCTRAR